MIVRITAAVVLVLGLAAGNATAATMSVGGTPTTDGDDIASLSGTTDVGGNFGHVWSNRARQGQTFTTGSNPGGYSLDAITMHVRVDQGSTIANLWNIRVGTIAGTTLTPIATETAVGVTIPQSTAGNGFPSYVTWALDTPVALLPSTVYGFDVDTNGQGGGFISLNDNSDPYPGGGRLTQPGVGANFTNLTPGSDRAFHLNVTAVSAIPEPSTLALAALSLLSLGLVGWRRRRR